MISARTMTPEDLMEVLDSAVSADVPYMDKMDRDQFKTELNVVSLIYDGDVVAVGGIHWFWPTVGEAWTILHERAHRNRLATYRGLKMMFNILIGQHDGPWHRIQATVRTDWPAAIRMAEKLGFARESVLRAYSPDGTDAYMYAMVRK